MKRHGVKTQQNVEAAERIPILSEVPTLNDYIQGKHIHLGHPAEVNLEPEELEQRHAKEMALINEIYAYEIKRGEITMENGLMKFTPEVLKRLPQSRCNHDINCCVKFQS